MAHGLFRKKSIPAILKEAEQGLSDGHGHGAALKKVLGVRDLTFMGIAAVIGAGIFSSIGNASYNGGPGVIFLYLFTAVACGFAALCYAEFASTVPVSGSAYTYSYVAFGEIFAWIIGWDLLMEYSIGNVVVAISWSEYFTGLLDKAGMHIPDWLTMDYVTAKRAFAAGSETAVRVWNNAPQVGGMRIFMDLPAAGIVVLITYIVFRGIKESRSASNLMVIIKLAVIFFVIVMGAYYVHPENWSPFTPNGVSGILKGVSAVFFAYIGFDAISTTAEECKNPQRDLPRGMIYSLIICTILYVLLALVLTGMVPYSKLNVGDPLAEVFDQRGLGWIAGVISVSAIVATASVLLVFQLGQPRIWMSMSRDGLLPKIFSRIHPKYGTPSFSTILTGFFVGIPALFLNLDLLLALTSIGTLFAFVLVCAGVLVLQKSPNRPESKFRVPHVSGKFIVPFIFITSFVLAIVYSPDHFKTSFTTRAGFPMAIFWTIAAVIAVLSFIKNFSLIPVLGFTSCFYLMAQESATNWERFIIWLAIGLVIYFTYGYKHSRLRKENEAIENKK
ncbi:MAG: amino acid transporter [Flavisolibacter sp.]|jgi:APA family basic amino acid/polyamine antiporter|nr:amino acid transporter [Flavisolibacter sp.]